MADYTLAIKVTGDGRLAVQAIDDVTDAGRKMQQGLGQASDQASRSFQVVGDAAVNMDAQIERVTETMLKWGGVIAGFHELGEFGDQIVEASTKLAGWQYGLQAATGSTQGAAQALSFVRQKSDRLGISLDESASTFTRLTAATHGTALEGAKTQQIFTAVSEAARALHLSGQETSQALNALDQMMSKGQVTAQDLKLQLGNVLPGAVHVMADALGVSTQQLEKMMAAGQVLSDDALPKLAARLHDIYGEAASEAAQAPAAQIQRMKNAVLDLEQAIGSSGFYSAVGEGAKAATVALKALADQAAATETLVLAAVAGKATSWIAAKLQAQQLKAQTAELTAAELAEAQAAEAEAAAQLSKVKVFAGVATSAIDVAKAEATLAAAQVRTAEATAAMNAATVATPGLLARIGNGLKALAGGEIGIAVLAIGGLVAGWMALQKAEADHRAQFKATLDQFDQATKKASDLHAELQQLAQTPPPLADELTSYQGTLDAVAKAQDAVAKNRPGSPATAPMKVRDPWKRWASATPRSSRPRPSSISSTNGCAACSRRAMR